MEQIFEPGVYYAPGRRVLYYFSVNKIVPVVFVFIVLEIASSFLINFFNLQKFGTIVSNAILIAGIVSCFFAFVLSFIKYKSVVFMFDEFAFHIKKGFLSKTEVAIPYRQIQSINHSQSFNQKMLSIMSISIETAGENVNENKINDDGVLPILEAKLALSIEGELLKRSNINK